MWLCTRRGFVSAVQDFNRPEMLVVRARKREHLERLLPDEEVVDLPSRDYAHRIFVKRDAFKALLQREIDALSYHNFKDAVEDDGLHDLYLDFWQLHLRYQHLARL